MFFLTLLYNRFAKTFTSTSRSMFIACVVTFLAKVIQSLEGARSVHEKIPEALWKLLQPEFAEFGWDASGEAPSFFDLMQTCIPHTAEGFHEKLAKLDDWKFNLVPKALNAVDVVLRGALSMKVASWRVWVFWMQLVPWSVASPTMLATC